LKAEGGERNETGQQVQNDPPSLPCFKLSGFLLKIPGIMNLAFLPIGNSWVNHPLTSQEPCPGQFIIDYLLFIEDSIFQVFIESQLC
jgi:hypothetical protein